MIFKHLFTPKWKHPKINVRLNAIDKLDPQNDTNVLTSLAFEDDSAEIRKKALQKINDYTLWWKAYKQDSNLKDLAEQHITQAVLNKHDGLSLNIKNEYIDKYASDNFIEKLAINESEIQAKVKLLKRLASKKLIENTFKTGCSELQIQLLELVKQYKLEKPLLNKAIGEAKTKLETYIEQQHQAKIMPEKIDQQVKMVLAKLNALRDKNNFRTVNEQYTLLVKEWEGIELFWLNEELIDQAKTKYFSINNKLTDHLEKIKMVYDNSVAEKLARQEQQDFLIKIRTELEQFEDQVSHVVSKLQIEKQAHLRISVKQIEEKILASKYCDCKELTEQLKKISALMAVLENLSFTIDNHTQLNECLTQLEKIQGVDDINLFDDVMAKQKSLYEQCRQKISTLPLPLQQEKKTHLTSLSTKFKSDMNSLKVHQDTHLKHAKKKSRDVQRLLEQGRFNVAFGVFKGFTEHFSLLTENNKRNLEKVYVSQKETLANARDWQKYAATPKRVELLEELDRKLQENDLAPNKRVNEVKSLRKRWNELGRVDTEEELAQAKMFDEKIEKLFAPCREHFAQLDLKKAQAKEQREQLIIQLNDLSNLNTEDADFDWRGYENQYNKLLKHWRNAGSVTSEVYKLLHQQFKQAVTKISNNIDAFHNNNAIQKSSLVEQAKQLVEADDLTQACDGLKGLQKQWQKIGFAGSKKEHSLWQMFRECNDVVFAKRSQLADKEKQQKDEVEVQQQAELDSIASKLLEILTLDELIKVKREVSSLELLKTLKKSQTVLLEKIDSMSLSIQEKQEAERYNSLLESIKNDSTIDKQWFVDVDTPLKSEQLILRLEILKSSASPEQYKQQRMAEQVAMLDEKLQGSQVKEFDEILKEYLTLAIENQQLEPQRVINLLS